MHKINSELMLTRLLEGNDLGRAFFAAPPPWREIYPPHGFIDAMAIALLRVNAKSIHYAGLADESILRWICSLDATQISVMDMVDWWGMDQGEDADTFERQNSRLPTELKDVMFYSEGAPRKFQALVQDMRLGSNAAISFYRRMAGAPHCVAFLGLALENCPRPANYEWQSGTGFLIGISNPIEPG
jgi:hypothetical protein